MASENSFFFFSSRRRHTRCRYVTGVQTCALPILLKARDYLVVVEHSEQVRALAPDFPALARLEDGIGGVIVTAPGEGDIDYVTRFFCPAIGINEDPATGSIGCTLAPYWADRLGKATLRARQLSVRGGELRCQIDGDRVKIAGHTR